MVPSIARQSVILKCLRKKSILLGNYEFYYAAGLMKKLYHLDISEEMEPESLFHKILENLGSITPGNENEEYLIGIMKNYRLQKEYDDDTKTLFRWGETEEAMWQITTSQKVPHLCQEQE